MDLGQVLNSLFDNLTLAGFPLVVFVLATVQWVKESFSIEGKPVNFVSMGIGIVFGVLYQFSRTNGFPTDFNGWLTVVVFGIALGLLASGTYKTFNNFARNVSS